MKKRHNPCSLLTVSAGISIFCQLKHICPSKSGCPTFRRLCATLEEDCLGPHIKYIVTRNHTKKSNNVLSKFMILCWPHSQPSWAACGPRATGWTPLQQRDDSLSLLDFSCAHYLVCVLGSRCEAGGWRCVHVQPERPPFCHQERKAALPTC